MANQSPYVFDVTDANFEQLVLEESLKRPVIVDFWATWCGPCRTLGPALEDLAEEYAGAFLLAKVDVDQNQAIASAARIQSIPTVVAVFGGGFIDQFVGAQPKPEVKRFIDDVLAKAGVEGPPEPAKVPTDPAQALRYWRAKVAENTDDGAALLALGRLYLSLQKLDEARETLERIALEAEEHSDAQASLRVMGLLTPVGEAGGAEAVQARLDANPNDARAAFLVACSDAGQGRFVEALEALISLVASGPPDVRAEAKKAASTVLQATGRDDPKIEEQRRRFSGLLF